MLQKISLFGPETVRSNYEQAEGKTFLLKGRTRICCKRLGRFVVSGEMPIEHSDSWFSTKSIEVECLIDTKKNNNKV